MNKILKQITKEMYETDLDFIKIRKGNYLVIRNEKTIRHYYFGNLICYVDLETKQFYLHHCGYLGYPLTTAQLNYLEQFYKNKGYILIYRGK